MPITIGSNIASLNAQRQLSSTSNGLASVYERLSSGQRINSASDDAAGLAIASSLNSSSRIFTRAINNINDGIGALNIAQGALQSLSNIVTRQFELAEQAANGIYSLSQRRGLNSENDALIKEFNRIISSVKFNDINLFNASSGAKELRIQAGIGVDGSILTGIGTGLMHNFGTGTFSSVTSYQSSLRSDGGIVVADFNGDGNMDIAQNEYFQGFFEISLGNGDGTFQARRSYSSNGARQDVFTGDINGDGKVDLFFSAGNASGISVAINNGDGTFGAAISHFHSSNNQTVISVGDFNGDGFDDYSASSATNRNAVVMLGNGDGTFRVGQTMATLTYRHNTFNADVNGDGKLDLISGAAEYGGKMYVAIGNGDGTFGSYSTFGAHVAYQSIKFVDVNDDGRLDAVSSALNGSADSIVSIMLGNGNGTFGAETTFHTIASFAHNRLFTGDINNDGYLDIAVAGSAPTDNRIFINNGNGTFRSGVTLGYTSYGSIREFADVNNDGVLDVIGGNISGSQNVTNYQYIGFGDATQSGQQTYFNILTQENARNALDSLRLVADRVAKELGTIGSHQSRLQTAYSVIDTARINYIGAASRIMDADIAGESAELAKLSILQKIGASVLAQVNIQPQIALKLLG